MHKVQELHVWKIWYKWKYCTLEWISSHLDNYNFRNCEWTRDYLGWTWKSQPYIYMHPSLFYILLYILAWVPSTLGFQPTSSFQKLLLPVHLGRWSIQRASSQSYSQVETHQLPRFMWKDWGDKISQGLEYQTRVSHVQERVEERLTLLWKGSKVRSTCFPCHPPLPHHSIPTGCFAPPA